MRPPPHALVGPEAAVFQLRLALPPVQLRQVSAVRRLTPWTGLHPPSAPQPEAAPPVELVRRVSTSDLDRRSSELPIGGLKATLTFHLQLTRRRLHRPDAVARGGAGRGTPRQRLTIPPLRRGGPEDRALLSGSSLDTDRHGTETRLIAAGTFTILAEPSHVVLRCHLIRSEHLLARRQVAVRRPTP